VVGSGKVGSGSVVFGKVWCGWVRQGKVFLKGVTKMATAKVEVKIKGKSSLLMHKFPLVPIEGFEKLSMEEQAEHCAYRDPDTNELYIPGVCIQRSLIGAATYSKGKGRASLQKIAAACIMISPERIPLGVKKYTIDSRAVVVPATKGRIVRHRPRLDEWECTFFIEYESTLLTEQQVRKIVDDSGQRVGLLDFRPERKGPFGRYMVISWKPDKKKKIA